MSVFLKIDPENPETEVLEEPARILREGGVVIIPTETVYGIAAVYNQTKAIKRIYQIKKRSIDKSLTIHLRKTSEIQTFAKEVNDSAKRIIERLLPGPLTLILKGKQGLTIGIRVPRNLVFEKLSERVGEPLVATSANLSGAADPTRISEIDHDLLSEADCVIDSGPTTFEGPSTVIDLTKNPPCVRRAGAVPRGQIEEVLGWVATSG
jgi:L-threonylcarbamoyladenylate synthase